MYINVILDYFQIRLNMLASGEGMWTILKIEYFIKPSQVHNNK